MLTVDPKWSTAMANQRAAKLVSVQASVNGQPVEVRVGHELRLLRGGAQAQATLVPGAAAAGGKVTCKGEQTRC